MKILLKSVQILSPGAPFHRKKTNILINNGTITEIGSKNYRADKTISGPNLVCSIGWIDMSANFCDPGYEHKEDLSSGAAAAASGGFTEVVIQPNTNPILDSKNEITYIQSGNHSRLVQLHPMGAVSVNTKGEDLTEMIDMHESGAVAFSEGVKPIGQSDLLLKSLLYVQKFNGLIIDRPEDYSLNQFGTMHEGVNSTLLGMKGIPGLSEELIIKRDIDLLKYTGGKLHFSNLSSGGSLKIIREAKKSGLEVTCDLAAYQPIFTDDSIGKFDTNFKVNPPFRDKKDNKELIGGLQDGTIDVIVSNHQPQDEESKKLEFDLAEFGVISSQTVLPCLVKLSKEVDLQVLLNKITVTPRKILGLSIPKIEVGEIANLTLFDTKYKWVFDSKSNNSKSENSPFFGQELIGKARGVFNNGHHQVDDDLLEVS